jgi:adenine specific DNA methylase mod-like protein
METTNLSKIRREKMLETIKEIKKNITDEVTLDNLSMIENELTKKKYGLIWEEHEERVDKELETQIPTFEEVKNKEIKLSNDNKFNFLLEGDNLHSLYLLEKTHKEKIDVIYIDPPYNTGNKDFTYGDKILDSVDEFKHSKWLSFMNRRLKYAYKILSKYGLIIISIDDNEQAPLKMLCDEIFGEENFIGCLPRRTKSSGKTTNNISSNHDYLLIYSKNINLVPIIGITHNDDGFKYSDKYEFERGKYKLNQTLDYDSLSYSSSLDYPIEIDGKTIYPGGSYENYIERKNGNYKRADWAWRWSKDLYEFGLKNDFIVIKKGKDGNPRIYTKTYLNAKIVKSTSGYEIQTEERKKPISSLEFTDNIYSNDNAKKDLIKIFTNAVFDYPKPVEMIKTLLKIYNNKDALILDFFAGSGTTAQAVNEINNEDCGTRRFILCTNNENNICENITYNRIEKTKTSNLKYYKCSYIPRLNSDEQNLNENLMKNIKNLIQLENGIEIDNAKVQVYLNEDTFDEFTSNKELLNICEKVYISSNILITAEQEMILENNNIEVFIIPEYYFEDEIMEVM